MARVARKLGIRGITGYLWRRMTRGEDYAFVRMQGLKLAVRPNSPDLEVVKSSLRGEFEPLTAFCEPDFSGLIVDAGGYIGTAALMLHRYFPRATIVSIEPSAENFSLLVRNTLQVKEIYPIRAALCASPDRRPTLSDRGTGPWGYTVVDQPQDSPDAEGIGDVPAITLRQISEMFGKDVGILKLDIEGGEYELFAASASDLKKIPVLFVELHDRIVPGCTEQFLALSQDRLVREYGGEKFVSVDQSVMQAPESLPQGSDVEAVSA